MNAANITLLELTYLHGQLRHERITKRKEQIRSLYSLPIPGTSKKLVLSRLAFGENIFIVVSHKDFLEEKISRFTAAISFDTAKHHLSFLLSR